jgi:hypothetical protein
LLTSCGKIEEEPYNSPPVEAGSISKNTTSGDNSSGTNSPRELIYNTFEELASTNDEYSLEIRKKGDAKTYKASDMLRYTVLDMLQKSETLDMSVINDSDFDYNKYDYILHWTGQMKFFFLLSKILFIERDEK